MKISRNTLVRTGGLPVTPSQVLALCSLLLPLVPARMVAAQQDVAQQTKDTIQTTDVVTFGPATTKAIDAWSARKRTTIFGKIIQFDFDSLTLRQTDGASSIISSDRLERVEIAWTSEPARMAQELLDGRKYREANQAIPAALQSGIPHWQQQFLIAGLVRSAVALGSPKSAGVFFLNLTDSSPPPPPMLYAEMPLCWAICEPDSALKRQASEWLTDEDVHAKLLGASWLLFGPESQKARRALLELQAALNETIAKLAVAQSWRLVPPPETKRELSSWLKFRDGLIEPLQLGPTEFIADRLARTGEVDLAMGQWMRIASLHRDRYDRAQNALIAARNLLERDGRDTEAKRLTLWIEQPSQP